MKKYAGLSILLLVLLSHSNGYSLTVEERSNVEVFKTASPSVVNITTTTLIRDFFSVYPREGAGSGTIISKEGHILTNNHVVEGAARIQVIFLDGKKYPATLVGNDPENDLAVIEVTADRDLAPIVLGDSDGLLVGQKVFAIGNPFGLNSTLTTGIISAVDRPLSTKKGMVIENVIQTDASINPGNSGGPLLDSEGKMIGVNTAIFSPSGGSVGIGFAIPINKARRIIPDLIKYGKVRKPWLGIIGVPLWDELAEALQLRVKRGILVSEVIKGGPAYESGLRGGKKPVQVSRTIIYIGGDVITKVDGKDVGSMEEIRHILEGKKEGRIVKMKIFRENTYKTLKVRIKLQT